VTHHDTYPEIDPIKSDCAGKYVMITGASKGIGKATAISYAKAGASHIAIAARSSLEDTIAAIMSAATAAGHSRPQILPLALDVCDRQSVRAAAEKTTEEFAHLDILVNNAGFLARYGPLLEADEEEYWQSWEVNYRGVYWVTKSFLPLILKGNDKTIINLSSVGAIRLAKGASSYQISKFAILQFSEFLMVDYGGQVSWHTISADKFIFIRLIKTSIGPIVLFYPPGRGLDGYGKEASRGTAR
jgi:NAD(P)-dependent dehydrogenase (short-subunit alcohol dehydrogenase family)